MGTLKFLLWFWEKKKKKLNFLKILIPLRRSGYRSGKFWINQGLHLSKSGPNSQYSGGKEHTGQYTTRTGWGFSAIVWDATKTKPQPSSLVAYLCLFGIQGRRRRRKRCVLTTRLLKRRCLRGCFLDVPEALWMANERAWLC